MPAGRPKTPTNLSLLRGNPSHRVLNKDEPKPAAASLEPPEWLNDAAKPIWEDYAPKLQALGLLTELDVELFAMACLQLSIYRAMMVKVGKSAVTRDGKVKAQFTVARRAFDDAMRVLARFGFSPSDRAKISVTPKTEDKFEDFLSGKKAE